MGLLPTWGAPRLAYSPSFLYIWGAPLENTPIVPSRVWRPTSQFTPPVMFSRCLGEALHGSHHHHRHHAIVLTELIYFLDILLDQEDEGRHRVERV